MACGCRAAADCRLRSYAAAFGALAQAQPITTGDLRKLDALNLQGKFVGMYLFGKINGIVRATQQGGDLITVASGAYVGVWLVKAVLEGWDSAGWCKVAVVQQQASVWPS